MKSFKHLAVPVMIIMNHDFINLIFCMYINHTISVAQWNGPENTLNAHFINTIKYITHTDIHTDSHFGTATISYIHTFTYLRADITIQISEMPQAGFEPISLKLNN